MSRAGIIILAAGGSQRLGTAKQLLVFQGRTLVEHLCEAAAVAGLSPVIFVTGSESDRVSGVLKNGNTQCVFNERWKAGISTSIVCGLQAIGDIEQVIIAVCDQPFISASVFRDLLNKQTAGGKGIIAAAYQDTVGTPILFQKKYFPALRLLTGDQGAKKLVSLHPDDMDTVPFEMGRFDIDTYRDYEELLSI